jgi:hypothetical protein
MGLFPFPIGIRRKASVGINSGSAGMLADLFARAVKNTRVSFGKKVTVDVDAPMMFIFFFFQKFKFKE